jgi:predicted transcriptional regulator of viral defense system
MNMSPPSGDQSLNQKQLIAITRGAHHTITVGEAAIILNMPTQAVAKLLARWTEAGNLSRIKRGLYLTSQSSVADFTRAEPWIIAEELFRPCYIGGMSAAAHWELTETTPHTNIVLTTKKPRNRHQTINGINFILRTISHDAMFGLLAVGSRVQVSDPTRTIIDFLVDPQLGGGIQNVADMFMKYLKSGHKNIDLLLVYAKHLRSGVVLKRLGFLLECFDPCELGTIGLCKILMSTCAVKLDPQLNADRLITRWGLWVPHNIEFYLLRKRV